MNTSVASHPPRRRGRPNAMKTKTVSLMRDLSLKSGVGQVYLFNRWLYNFKPNQLMFLCRQIKETADIDGCIVEAGCAFGATTVFMNKYMDDNDIDKPYFALDTFSGFEDGDLKEEIEQRGKKLSDIAFSAFNLNKKTWFDKSMEVSGVNRVTSMQADVKLFDFARLAPIAFCLLDVDLYMPTKAALPRIYDSLAPGGVLVVDDCQDQHRWDGAYQAFTEFVAERQLVHRVVHDKLGVVVREK